MGTKTITMYVSDIDGTPIPDGEAIQLSVRLPDGSTQQLDISRENYEALRIEGRGKLLRKRGRKPGSGKGATARRRTAASPSSGAPDGAGAQAAGTGNGNAGEGGHQDA